MKWNQKNVVTFLEAHAAESFGTVVLGDLRSISLPLRLLDFEARSAHGGSLGRAVVARLRSRGLCRAVTGCPRLLGVKCELVIMKIFVTVA